MNPTSPAGIATFDGAVNDARKQIKNIATYVKNLSESVKVLPPVQEGDKQNLGEMIANLMLSYRHLEDASMRLGKTLQAFDGGVSVYDKETTVGA